MGSALSFQPDAGRSGLGGWLDGYGIFGDLDGGSNASDVDYKIGGTSLGIDYRLRDHLLIGAAAGYAYTDIDFGQRAGSANADTFHGALYGGYVTPRYALGIVTRYAYSSMETLRRIAFGTINTQARADFSGYDVGAAFESSINALELGALTLAPLAAFEYSHIDQDGFGERGAVPTSLNLRVASENVDSIVSSIGARLHGSFEMDDHSRIVPDLRARWAHEFGDRDREIRAQIGGLTSGGAFVVRGAEAPRDSAVVGVGWTVHTPQNLQLFVDYDARINREWIEHSVALGLRLNW
jgi:outer membrane autotransporter protein